MKRPVSHFLRASLILVIALGLIAASSELAGAFPSFSITPASPSSPGVPPGDVLDPSTGAPVVGPQGAPVTAWPAATLGLPPAGNIDGLSFGDDIAYFAAPGWPLFWQFSVGPGAVGAPWLPAVPANVGNQAAEGSAAGDIFTATVGVAVSPPAPVCFMGGNVQTYDADGANAAGPVPLSIGGLVDPPPPPAAPPYDDVDAYEARDAAALDYVMAGGPGADGVLDGAIYYSVDAATAGAMGVSAADILVTDPSSPLGFVVYATAAALGLVAGDHIDALIVADSVSMAPGFGGALFPARAFGPQPMDFVGYSLAPGSPSLAGLPPICGGPNSPGDAWYVSPFFGGGVPTPMFAAEDLGLCTLRALCAADDNLDALDVSWGADADADGLPDATEGGVCGGAVAGAFDADGDGLWDGLEAAMGTNAVGGPCSGIPLLPLLDSDGDLLVDGWEMKYYTAACPVGPAGPNASTPDGAADPDGDTMTNLMEQAAETNPCIAPAVGGVGELPGVADAPSAVRAAGDGSSAFGGLYLWLAIAGGTAVTAASLGVWRWRGVRVRRR